MKDRPRDAFPRMVSLGLRVPSETGRAEWRRVCRFISKRLPLRTLHLHINTFLWDDQPWERIENSKSPIEHCLKLDWVQSVMMIQNLKDLRVEFDHRYFSKKLKIGAVFVELLKERMLQSDSSLQADISGTLFHDKT